MSWSVGLASPALESTAALLCTLRARCLVAGRSSAALLAPSSLPLFMGLPDLRTASPDGLQLCITHT